VQRQPQTVPAPPPDPPEFPEGARPRWPAWYAAVAFLVALSGTFIAVGIIAAITGNTSNQDSPTFTIAGTLVQDVIFVATAVGFASLQRRPRAWHFGLTRTRLWSAVRWAGLGILAFYFLSFIYQAVVHPDTKQVVTQQLGANRGTLGLIVAGIMVIVVAPAAEEFFFRGFFYRALRSRFSVIAAAVIDGLLFGAIHYDFSGGNGLLIVPPLALLGFIFCLVYERTGSIYPTIALHSFNNTIAYAVQADGGAVSAVLGPAMIAACVLVPRFTRAGPRPAPAVR
jgi:membrane protease YdiL (CAAX protease family)